MFPLSRCSRIHNLAMTLSIAGSTSQRLPSLTTTTHRFHSSLVGRAARPTTTSGVSRHTIMVQDTCRVPYKNMSSSLLVPSAVIQGPTCHGVPASPPPQALPRRPTQVSFSTDSKRSQHQPSITLDLSNFPKDIYIVPQESSCDEERNRLQREIQNLEARIRTMTKDIRWSTQGMDQMAAGLEAVRKALAAGERMLHTLKNDKLEDVFNQFSLLEREEEEEEANRMLQDLSRSNNEKSKKPIKDFLQVKEKHYYEKKQMLDQVSALLLASITDCKAMEKQLSEIQSRLQSGSDKNSSGSSEYSGTGKEPDRKKQQHWINLNEVIQRAARTTKRNFAWDQLKSFFKPTFHEQPRRTVNDEKLDFFETHVPLIMQTFQSLTVGKDIESLDFITAIMICVCDLFDEDIDFRLGEVLVGNTIKARVHFDFILRRGNKAVCVVQAKDDDFEKAMARCLVGCEVVAEVEGLDVVYGIVANHVQWSIFRSLNDKKVEMDRFLLDQTPTGPTRASLKKLAEKMYSMLSTE